MAMTFDTSQWDRASKALLANAEPRIRRDVVQSTTRRMAETARAAARSQAGPAGRGGASGYAAETIAERDTANGAEIHGGAGSGKGAQVFHGTEFGAQRRRRSTYVMRTAGRGVGVAVTRRTTRQFRPFVGRQGYYFWPAVRQGLRGIDTRVAETLTRIVEEASHG